MIDGIAITNCKSCQKNIACAPTLLDKDKSEVALHVKIKFRKQCYLYRCTCDVKKQSVPQAVLYLGCLSRPEGQRIEEFLHKMLIVHIYLHNTGFGMIVN